MRLATAFCFLFGLLLLGVHAHPPTPLQALEALVDVPNRLVRYVLLNVMRFNESAIERITTNKRESHPYILEINDDNFADLLERGDIESSPAGGAKAAERSGKGHGKGEGEERDIVWIINVSADDPFSKVFDKTFTAVADNSTSAGAELPSNVRLGLVDYMAVDILTTKWLIFKCPFLVVSTRNMTDLRFYKLGRSHIGPEKLTSFIIGEEWRGKDPWTGALAPGGSISPYLEPLGYAFRRFRLLTERVPNWILMLLTGAFGQVIISLMHTATGRNARPTDPPATSTTASPSTHTAPPTGKAGGASQESDTQASAKGS